MGLFSWRKNPQFPTAPTRAPFGISDVAARTPLLPQVIGIPMGQIQSNGFRIVGDGGYNLTGSIMAVQAGIGQISGQIQIQKPTDQVKDF